jgi:hypothetical protein
MKQPNKVLRITIPKPCSEDWNKMEQSEKGRFCSSCQKEIIDFSSLTDKELYQYFSNAKIIPCGIFHQSQLNTSIVPKEIKSKPWNHIHKKVAAVLAFLSLKPSGTMAQDGPQTVIQPAAKKNKFDSTKKIVIGGSVKDADGNVIEDAEISFNDKSIAKSDKEGKFQFEIMIDAELKSSIITVSYPGKIRAVRSYHPVMQSTSYNIVLETPEYFHNRTIGAPVLSGLIALLTLDMPPEGLNNNLRQRLFDIAQTLRYNPTIKIELTGYGQTHKEITAAKIQVKALRDYLANKEGIAEDRMILKIKPKEKTKRIGIVEVTEHNPDDE